MIDQIWTDVPETANTLFLGMTYITLILYASRTFFCQTWVITLQIKKLYMNKDYCRIIVSILVWETSIWHYNAGRTAYCTVRISVGTFPRCSITIVHLMVIYSEYQEIKLGMSTSLFVTNGSEWHLSRCWRRLSFLLMSFPCEPSSAKAFVAADQDHINISDFWFSRCALMVSSASIAISRARPACSDLSQMLAQLGIAYIPLLAAHIVSVHSLHR